MPDLTVSVLIPTWRRPTSLARCLNALCRQTRLPDELILAVRAEDEATHSMLAEQSLPFALELASPAAPSLVAALNVGFDYATKDLVAVTDDDTAPHADWIARIEQRFKEDSRLGGLGGWDRLVLQENARPDEGLAVGRILWFGRVVGNHHAGGGSIRDVDILKGANMAIRRSALGEIRIDVALRGSGTEHHSEVDLSLGLKAAGWRLAYDPGIVVDHYEEARRTGRRESEMSAGEHRDAIHNQTYAFLKHLPPGRRFVAIAYALLVGTRLEPGILLAIERVVLPRRSKPSQSGLRVRFDAMAGACAAWWRWRRGAH